MRRGAGARTSIGLDAVDGRTLASDRARFPKGAIGYLVTTQPRFAADGEQPIGWAPLERFVIDNDTGGGIRDAHVDLYWGRGAAARRAAGVMKQRGRLYYLVPR
jgi:membrane-bound lytic murein transglycosylase A